MKLHLGCGKKFIEGFVHVDMANYDHVDFKADVKNLHMFNSDSVDLIYACHVLEHFGRNEVSDVITEWYRVLKKGGTLRIAVPDFESVVNWYNNTGKISEVMGLVVGGQRELYDYHKIIFDECSLTALMKEVGFKQVHRYDWKDTEHSNMDDYSQSYLPHMDKENGMLMSLNIEAVK